VNPRTLHPRSGVQWEVTSTHARDVFQPQWAVGMRIASHKPLGVVLAIMPGKDRDTLRVVPDMEATPDDWAAHGFTVRVLDQSEHAEEPVWVGSLVRAAKAAHSRPSSPQQKTAPKATPPPPRARAKKPTLPAPVNLVIDPSKTESQRAKLLALARRRRKE